MSKLIETKEISVLVDLMDKSVEMLNDFVTKSDPLPKDEVFVSSLESARYEVKITITKKSKRKDGNKSRKSVK